MNIKEKDGEIRKDFFDFAANVPAFKILASMWAMHQKVESPFQDYWDWQKRAMLKGYIFAVSLTLIFGAIGCGTSLAIFIVSSGNAAVLNRIAGSIVAVGVTALIVCLVSTIKGSSGVRWQEFSTHINELEVILPYFHGINSGQELKERAAEHLVALGRQVITHQTNRQHKEGDEMLTVLKQDHLTLFNFGLVEEPWEFYLNKAEEASVH